MNHRHILAVTATLAALLIVPLPARAACTDPDGDVGQIILNTAFDVYQGCTAAGHWMAFHPVPPPPDCPDIGDSCSNGSYYIGNSPEDGRKVFMTAQTYEVTRRFDSATCSECGDGTIGVSQTDGRVNTNALLAFDATGFDAAGYCDSLEAHDKDDWYLPGGSGTGTEQNLFWNMVQAVGPVDGIGSSANEYWSSTEGDADGAYSQFFNIYDAGGGDKGGNNYVRCVRR